MRGGRVLGAVAFICALYLVTMCFGGKYVDRGVGYEKGNRNRQISMVKFELTMAVVNIFVYWRIMSYFEPYEAYEQPSQRPRRQRVYREDDSPSRRLTSLIVITWLILCLVANPLYWASDGFQKFWMGISLIALGVWNHVVVFLLGFFLVSMVLTVMNRYALDRPLLRVLSLPPLQPLKYLLTEPRAQVVVSVGLGLILAFGSWMSSDMLAIKEHVFYVKDLPSQANGMRLAIVTDVHAGAMVDEHLVAKVVDVVNSQKVDAVMLVGDLIDAPEDRIWERMRPLEHLEAKLGTYYVTGNHEYYYGDVDAWFVRLRKFGIHVLDGKAVNVSGICIAGMNDYSSGKSGVKFHRFNVVETLLGCDRKSPVIALSHNPSTAKEIAFNRRDFRVDLIFSGHTHAGQFYTVAPLAYLLVPYYYGVYRISPGTELLVSAGALYQGPPMKMLGMSQVWVVTLRAKEA